MEKVNGHNILALPESVVRENQDTSLYKARERLVVEAICRATGRTDYETNTLQDLAKECEVESEFYRRGKWVDYDDGSQVFRFDDRDMLLFHPPVTIQGERVQRYEVLYDKAALRKHHHTKEDERG